MSTNWLLIFVLVIMTVVSVFVPQILGIGVFAVGDGDLLPASPGVWDVLTFTGGWIWEVMTFSIPDMPWVLGLVFWFASFITIYCIIRLVRGTS